MLKCLVKITKASYVAQLVECLPSTNEALGLNSQRGIELGIMVCPWNAGTQEVDGEWEMEGQGQSWLHCEFQDNQAYLRP